jgi:hypothetical protein
MHRLSLTGSTTFILVNFFPMVYPSHSLSLSLIKILVVGTWYNFRLFDDISCVMWHWLNVKLWSILWLFSLLFSLDFWVLFFLTFLYSLIFHFSSIYFIFWLSFLSSSSFFYWLAIFSRVSATAAFAFPRPYSTRRGLSFEPLLIQFCPVLREVQWFSCFWEVSSMIFAFLII